MEPDSRLRDRLAGALLGDLAADHDAPRQGQVDRMLDRPFGPLEILAGGQVGLPFRGKAVTTIAVTSRRIHPEPSFAIRLESEEVGLRPRIGSISSRA